MLLEIREALKASDSTNEAKFAHVSQQISSLSSLLSNTVDPNGWLARQQRDASMQTQSVSTAEAWTQTASQADGLGDVSGATYVETQVSPIHDTPVHDHCNSPNVPTDIENAVLVEGEALRKPRAAWPQANRDIDCALKLPPQSVLIIGSLNVKLLHKHVGSMLGWDTRCQVVSHDRASLGLIVKEIRRRTELYNVQKIDQLIIVHAGINDILRQSDNADMEQLWQTIEQNLDELIEFCTDNLIRLIVCSIPVVTGGAGRDCRSNCQYINSRIATKLDNTSVSFRDFSYIQRAKSAMHVDGIRFGHRGSIMAARPIAREAASFLGVRAHIWNKQNCIKNQHPRQPPALSDQKPQADSESAFLFLEKPPPPLPPPPPPFFPSIPPFPFPPMLRSQPPVPCSVEVQGSLERPQVLPPWDWLTPLRSVPPHLPHPNSIPPFSPL